MTRHDLATTLNAQIEGMIEFKPLTCQALTSFFAFEIWTSDGGTETQCLSAQCAAWSVPANRRQQILCSLLQDKNQVLKLLLFLLAESKADARELLEAIVSTTVVDGEINHASRSSPPPFPLFEALVRTLDRNPMKLDHIARLVDDLRQTAHRDTTATRWLWIDLATDLCRTATTKPMTNKANCPDPTPILDGLKDFQRNTVEYVFRRLYLDADASDRFLVADEVGLGKTLVARGLICQDDQTSLGSGRSPWYCLHLLQCRYCSSKYPTAQYTGAKDFSLATRITLLPLELRDLKKNSINFISFTPGTSFDLKSSLGLEKERALLYWLLHKEWDLQEK